MALLLGFAVAEPAGRDKDGETVEAIGPTFAFLLSRKSFLLVLGGLCLGGFTNYLTSVRIAPFMAHVHHRSSAESGSYAGTFEGLFGIAGALLDGFGLARISKDDDRCKLSAPPSHRASPARCSYSACSHQAST